MKIVKRGYQSGDLSAVVRHLTVSEKLTLSESWSVNTKEWQAQQEFLLHLREQGHWIVCNCQSGSSPIMFPRRNPSGTYGLVNHVDHRDHIQECPFWTITRPIIAGKPVNKKRQEINFCFHNSVSDGPPAAKKDAGSSRKSNKVLMENGMIRLLYRLVSLAGLDRFDGASHYRHDVSMNKLKEAAKQLTLNKQFSISDWLYTDLANLNVAYRELRGSKLSWQAPAQPHALFLIMVDKFGLDAEGRFQVEVFSKDAPDSKWSVLTHTFPVNFTVNLSARVQSDTSGPYLMLFTVADPSGSTLAPFFSECKGALVPILTKEHPMPLSSRSERDMLKIVRKQIQWWHKERNINITAYKPNEDMISPESQQAMRPDIVLENGIRKSIISVMSSHEAGYKESKLLSLPVMSELGVVVDFDALVAQESGEFDKLCWGAAKAAIHAVLAPTK